MGERQQELEQRDGGKEEVEVVVEEEEEEAIQNSKRRLRVPKGTLEACGRRWHSDTL